MAVGQQVGDGGVHPGLGKYGAHVPLDGQGVVIAVGALVLAVGGQAGGILAAHGLVGVDAVEVEVVGPGAVGVVLLVVVHPEQVVVLAIDQPLLVEQVVDGLRLGLALGVTLGDEHHLIKLSVHSVVGAGGHTDGVLVFIGGQVGDVGVHVRG